MVRQDPVTASCRPAENGVMEAVIDPEDELAEFGLTEDEVDSMMAAGEQVELTSPPGAAWRSAFV